jgi:hypothetical protein
VGAIAQFENFCHQADRLKSQSLVQSGWDNSYSLNFTKGQGVTMSLTQPNEEQLRSLLLELRRFISPKDPAFINRIYNLCDAHITSDELKGLLRHAREQWKVAQRNSGMRLVMNERQITPAHLADLWINGHYFHGSIDDPKTLELRELGALLGIERFEFIGYVGETLRQVLYVDNILRHALRDGCVRD